MTRICLSLALFLGACSTNSTVSIRPDIPPLPADVEADCGALADLLDDTTAALIRDDQAVRSAFVDCRGKHRKAVEAYNRVRATVGTVPKPKP